MKKLLIELYTVTDQQVYDDVGNVQPINHFFNQLVQMFNNSYMKNKVELKMIDVLKETYDEEQVKENLSQGHLLPWVYFDGELTFYNGLSESMIFQEAMRFMTYKIIKRR